MSKSWSMVQRQLILLIQSSSDRHLSGLHLVLWWIHHSPFSFFQAAALCIVIFAAPAQILPLLILSTLYQGASQVALLVTNLPADVTDVRDTGSIPGSGRPAGGGKHNSLQYSCLENPTDRGAWWATVHRVTKSQTWLKRLSTHIHAPGTYYMPDFKLGSSYVSRLNSRRNPRSVVSIVSPLWMRKLRSNEVKRLAKITVEMGLEPRSSLP